MKYPSVVSQYQNRQRNFGDITGSLETILLVSQDFSYVS